jgi:RNA polymerase sigma-70 factor (ECF subfamily)
MNAAAQPRDSRESSEPAVLARNAGSFDAFYLVEFPKMVVWATALTGDPATAEELAQEALLRTYRHWWRISGYERPGAWTRRVTMNLAFSARTRRRAESAALERLANIPRRAEDDDLVDAAAFWAVVRRLPRRQCAAVTLHYLEDWSVADIAAELGCSENTAKAHLFKGRRSLARLLDVELDS